MSAGEVKVRVDDRFALVEASSLRISGVDVADTGKFTVNGGKKKFDLHQKV